MRGIIDWRVSVGLSAASLVGVMWQVVEWLAGSASELVCLAGPAAVAVPLIASGIGAAGSISAARTAAKAGSAVGQFATDPFASQTIQGFLPAPLQRHRVNPIFTAGIEGIGELVRNPGRLSPNVAEAIGPQLATTSEGIAQNFRGIRSQQAGATARGNVPVSIRAALDSALNVAESRSQRGARRAALTQSDQLRRQDLAQIFPLLDAILQFSSSRVGGGITGLGASAQLAQQDAASQQALIGSLVNSIAGINFGGGGSPGAPSPGHFPGPGPGTFPGGNV